MTRKQYARVPAEDVIAFAELMSELELQHVGMFGRSVNAAFMANVKAADLKGQRVRPGKMASPGSILKYGVLIRIRIDIDINHFSSILMLY